MHVLYVDDEVGLLETTKKILELIGPFHVETVPSVKEAMKKLEETEFDVIVSDYQMPEKDGLDFLRELRENGNRIPLILFTGKGREEIAIKALNLGADFYINKIGRPDTVYNQLSHSITQAAKKRKAEKRLKYKVNFESVIARISSRFVNLDDLNVAINESLEDMGKISAASRVYIFLLQKNGTMMDNTYEWCASGIAPQIENLKNLPVEAIPWWMNQLYDGKTIHITDVSLMPSEADAERELLENQDIKSAIVFPINVSGELAGFIGFDNVEKTGAWSSDDLALLQIVSELIGTTLERKRSEERYRTVFENTGTAMCILEEDKTISKVNREFEELSGYSREEVEGKKWTCFITEKCLEQMQRYHEARRKAGKKPPRHYSFEFVNKMGQTRNGLLTIEMIPGTKQSVASILDITEQKKAEEMLKKAGEKFETYFDLTQIMLIAIDVEGNVSSINKKGCEILGYEKEEIVGKNWFNNFLPKRLRKETKTYFKKILSGQIEPVEYHENHILTKDGKERLIAWHNTLLRDEQGNIASTLSSGEDITEMRKTKDNLKKSDEIFKAIFNGSSDGILSADPETKKFVFANPAICKLTGYSLKELLSLSVDDIHPKEDLPHVVDQFTQQIQGIITVAKDIPILRKDKNIVYCDINSGIIKIGKEEVLLGFFRDVTERKKTEKALHQEQEMLEAVTQNAGAGLTLISKDYHILWANHILKGLFGEIEGKTCYQTYHQLNKVCSGCGAKEIIETGKNRVVYHQKVPGPNGQAVCLEIIAAPIRDKRGNIIAVAELSIDVTERKQTEKALEEAKNKFETYLSLARVIMVALDTKGNITYVNERFCEVFESNEGNIGKNWFSNFIPARFRSETEMIFKRLMSGDIKPIELYENPVLTKSGEERLIAWRNILLKDENGKIIGTLSSGEDITERKKMEQELKKSEEKYRMQFEEALDAIFLADAETGILVDCNRAATELVGRTKSEIIGKHQRILHPLDESKGRFTEGFKKHLNEDRLRVLEDRIITKNGEIKDVAIKATIFELGNRRIMQGTFRDITERKKAEKALRESADKYRELINAMNDTVWVIDFDAKFIDVNDAAVRVLGYSREELLSMGPTDIDDTLPSEEIKVLINGMKTDEIQVFETAHTTKYRKKIPVEISSSLVTYNGKQAILSIARDITERKQAEEKLHASEERFRQLVENAPEAIYMNDIEGRFVDGNKKAEELTGYKKEELIGKNMLVVNLFPEKYVPTIIEGLKANIGGQKTGPTELELIKKDGSIIVIENVSIPLKREGKIEVMGVARDITEPKRLEKALRESEERFKQVAENAAEWIWEVDVDGLYTYSSPVVEKLLGYQPEEIVGRKHFYDLFPPEDQENLKIAAFSAFKEKQSFREFVNRNIDKNGDLVWLSTSGVPILDDEGKLVGYRGADVDITDRKNAEDAVDAMVDELEKVIEKLRVVGKATRHDVRNKLAVIANNIYLANQHLAGGDNAPEYLNLIESTIGKIEEIFDFASTYEMIGTEERSYIDAETSVKEAVILFSGLGVTKLENECHGLTVLADSQLRQVFYNLIDNSMKHGETVTKIRVHYEEKDDLLKLIYEDNGVGIPANEKELIFKEGYGKGTGYGLYLIQKICESYGWTIQETGTPGKGAQFTITVPRKNEGWKTSR